MKYLRGLPVLLLLALLSVDVGNQRIADAQSASAPLPSGCRSGNLVVADGRDLACMEVPACDEDELLTLRSSHGGRRTFECVQAMPRCSRDQIIVRGPFRWECQDSPVPRCRRGQTLEYQYNGWGCADR